MNESNIRITQEDNPPTDAEVERWIGKEAYQFWKQVRNLIERTYSGVFVPEWLYGGAKHGWALRFKKDKSFCTLIPEKNRFALLIVFGAEEQEKVDAIRNSLSTHTWKEYDKATTNNDGKWLLLTINSDKVVEDVGMLLAIKRKPKKS